MRDAAKHDGDDLSVGIVLDEPLADVIRHAMPASSSFSQSIGKVVRNAVNGSEGIPIRLARDSNLMRGPMRGHPGNALNIRRVVELLVEEPVDTGQPHMSRRGHGLAPGQGPQGAQAIENKPISRLRVVHRLVQCPSLSAAHTVNPGGGGGQPPRR